MPAAFYATLDRREEEAYIRRFSPIPVEKVMRKASAAGAVSAKRVMLGYAPIGTGRREGQFYRDRNWGHGTFRSSIRASAIRRRGMQVMTVGHVIGPMGAKGFIRAWREAGTRRHGKHPGSAGTHFVVRSASGAFVAARTASEAFLVAYAQKLRGD